MSYTYVSRQLAVNIVQSNTWCQLRQGAGGTIYNVPSSGSNPRADLKMMRAIDLSGGSSYVELAFSTASGSITDAHKVWPKMILRPNGYLEDEKVHVARSGEAVWARVTGAQTGTPNVTLRVSLMEFS